MDFRAIDATSLSWNSWYKGQPVARLAGGGRLQVQTPTAACRVSVAHPGMYRVELSLRPDVAAHAAFREWVADIERSAERAAAEDTELAAWMGVKQRSATVYNDTMRLTAFSDTLTFDQHGTLSAALMDAAACACLLELSGCWSSDQRWGLRWRIVQLKFDTVAPTFPTAPVPPCDSSPRAANNGGGYDFVDDP